MDEGHENKDLEEDEELAALRLAALATLKSRRKQNSEDNSAGESLPIKNILSTSSSTAESENCHIPPYVQSDRNFYNGPWRKQSQTGWRRRGDFSKSTQRSNLIVISPVPLDGSKQSDEKPVTKLALPQHKWCNDANEDSMSPKTLRRTGPTRFNRHGSDSESSDSDYDDNSADESGSNETVLQDELPDKFNCSSKAKSDIPNANEKQRRLSFQNLETGINIDALDKAKTKSIYDCLKNSDQSYNSTNKNDNFESLQNPVDEKRTRKLSSEKEYKYNNQKNPHKEDLTETQISVNNGDAHIDEINKFSTKVVDSSTRQHDEKYATSNSYYTKDSLASDSCKTYRNDSKFKDYSNNSDRSDYHSWKNKNQVNTPYRTIETYNATDSKANYSNSYNQSLSEGDLRLELRKRLHEYSSDKSTEGENKTFNQSRSNERNVSKPCTLKNNFSHNSHDFDADYHRNRQESNFKKEIFSEFQDKRYDYNSNQNQKHQFNFRQTRNKLAYTSSTEQNKNVSSSGLQERKRYSRSCSHERSRLASSKEKYGYKSPSRNKHEYKLKSERTRQSRYSNSPRSRHSHSSSSERSRYSHSSQKSRHNHSSSSQRSRHHSSTSRSSSDHSSSSERSRHDRSSSSHRSSNHQSTCVRKNSRHDQSSYLQRKKQSSSPSPHRSRRSNSLSSQKNRHKSSSSDRSKHNSSSERSLKRHKHESIFSSPRNKRNSVSSSPQSRDSSCSVQGRLHISSEKRNKRNRSSSCESKKLEQTRNKKKMTTHNIKKSDNNSNKEIYLKADTSDKSQNKCTADTDRKNGNLVSTSNKIKSPSHKNECDSFLEESLVKTKSLLSKPDQSTAIEKDKCSSIKNKEHIKNDSYQESNSEIQKRKKLNLDKSKDQTQGNPRDSPLRSCKISTNYKRHTKLHSRSASSSSTSSSKSEQNFNRSIASVIKSVPSKVTSTEKSSMFNNFKIGSSLQMYNSKLDNLLSKKDLVFTDLGKSQSSSRFSQVGGDMKINVPDSNKRMPVHMRLGMFPRKRVIQMAKDVEAAFVNSSSSDEESVKNKCKMQTVENIRIVTDVNKKETGVEKRYLGKEKVEKRSSDTFTQKSKKMKTYR